MYKREQELILHYNSHVKYYSPVREDTIDAIIKKLEMHLSSPPLYVLDLGCGTGWFAHYMHLMDHMVIGVDFAIERIRRAASEHPGPEYVCTDIHEFLSRPKPFSFDIITLWDVLEHLVDPALLLEAANKNLAPGGKIYASIPKDHEYIAHLQVYKNRQQVHEQLNPSKSVTWRDARVYYLCTWEKQDVSAES